MRSLLFSAWLLTVFPLQTWSASSGWDGSWTGGFDTKKGWQGVNLHVSSNESGTTATFDLPYWPSALKPTMGKEAVSVKADGDSLRWVIPKALGGCAFDGRLSSPDVMNGHVTWGASKALFHLQRVASAPMEDYVGLYKAGEGHRIRVIIPRGFVPGLLIFDEKTGFARAFLPANTNTFQAGPSLSVFQPVETTATFTASKGGGCKLALKTEGSELLQADRIDFATCSHERKVSFANGDVTLKGKLITPLGDGPHPCIVMVHGSGPTKAEDFRPAAEDNALLGIATLIYDKRGVGESTGDWEKAGLEELAHDALAGVTFLKRQPGIDSKRIGLNGLSQGGWIISAAAAESKDVAFIINIVGPGVGVQEQCLFTLEQAMRGYDFPEEDISEALELQTRVYSSVLTNSTHDEVRAAIKAVENKPWMPFLTPISWLPPNGSATWSPKGNGKDDGSFPKFCAFDPKAHLEKVTCPVLGIWGELDPLVPAQKSLDIWRESLAKASNTNVTLRIVPKAAHGPMELPRGAWSQLPRVTRFSPEFAKIQTDWLRAHGIARAVH